MYQEIERKFLPKELPNLTNLKPITYERYYLRIENGLEERIQKKGNKYEFERKVRKSDLTRDTQRKEITKEEFEKLKQNATRAIQRDSYKLQDNPKISIKIYQGDYEGLVRVEVEFESEEQAGRFIIPDWFGREITTTKLGKDSRLIQLSKSQFQQELSKRN